MTGWYGKIPASGDFIVRRLPASFREPWDGWLQGVMAEARERLGGHWADAYLSMPLWRFVLAPGVVSDGAWAGLLVPSVDAVGRHFPLTIATALPPAGLDAQGTLLGAAAWFDALETVALEAIAGAPAARVDEALARQPFRSVWIRRAPAPAPAPAAWLAEACEVLERSLRLGAALPSAEEYCDMMGARAAAQGRARH